MNIAWFTPLSKRSAIGRCSAGIVAALSKIASVEVFCFDAEETHPVEVPVRRFATHDSVNERILSEYDIAIYNFGNYLPFHRDIFELSRRFPGIAILHDFVLHHFFASYYLEHLQDSSRYIEAMERLYGTRGMVAATDSLSKGPRIWETDEVVDYPLFELVTGGCSGVVTHSDFLKNHVEQSFGGPVRALSLPYSIDRDSPVMSRKDLALSEAALLIVTIGHANRNKRIASTLEALGQIETGGRPIQYVIAGPCDQDYLRELEKTITQRGLGDSVRIAGEVSDQELRSYLFHADICVNLRWPAIEGASASAIEEMLFEKPLIVGNVGFYAELPDDSVVKIDPQSVTELRDALQRLASMPDERKRLGLAAREYADRQFRTDRYAHLLVDFIAEVRRSRPLLRLTDDLAGQLNHFGVTPDMQIVEGIASELGALFGES